MPTEDDSASRPPGPKPLASPSAGRFEVQPLPYVACVSWPRSGHHVLVRALQKIFKLHFGYCEFYGPSVDPKSGCCGKFPCAQAGLISMSKTHDFDLDAELPEGTRHIVQYRKFSEAVISEFELLVAKAADKDNAETFKNFAERRARTYARFIQKWVQPRRPNRVLLDYADFVTDPHKAMRDILRLYDAQVYASRIAEEIEFLDHVSVAGGQKVVNANRGIKQGRDVLSFRYYDEALFERLETMAGRTVEDEERIRRRRARRRRKAERRASREDDTTLSE